MLYIKKFTFYFFQENSYVVWDDSGECALIDPGCEHDSERKQLHGFIASKGLKPGMILLTHAHLDHIYGVREAMDKYDIPVYMDPKEQSSIDTFNKTFTDVGLHRPEKFDFTGVEDGQLLHFGNTDVRVLATPGHSLGGVCWWFEKDKAIFTGDTLFAGSVGRTDNNCASYDDLMASLRGTLMQLDGETDVYPGHGPQTTIGMERASNPFIYEDYTTEDLLHASNEEF